MSDITTISRRQLYEEIWATPLGELSKRYGLSSEGIARACTRHKVPRPRLGYWSKKRAGWADPPPPLPPLDDPKLESVALIEAHPDDVPEVVGPVRHAVDDEVNRHIEEELAAPPIIVPDKVRSPHRFVDAAMEEHARRVADERRRKSDPNYHTPEIEPRVRANVFAHSKETRDRAYRIMDTLLKTLEERGYEVAGTPEKYGGTTLVTVLGVKFDVRLHEPCRRQIHLLTPDELRRKKENKYVYAPSHDKVPTGRLCLEFRVESGWMVLAHRQDGERVRLEHTLKELIIAVLRKVDAERQADQERKRKENIRREAEANVRLEEERRKQLAMEQEQEEARLKTLLAEVKRWRDSQEIRAYLDEIRRVIAARGQVIQPGGKLDQWMKWAGTMAHRLDPLRPRDTPAGPTA